MSLETKVIEIVARELEKKVADIKPEFSFKEDLGADSLALYQLMIALQDEFDIVDDPPEEDFLKIKTVGNVIDYIKSLLG